MGFFALNVQLRLWADCRIVGSVLWPPTGPDRRARETSAVPPRPGSSPDPSAYRAAAVRRAKSPDGNLPGHSAGFFARAAVGAGVCCQVKRQVDSALTRGELPTSGI